MAAIETLDAAVVAAGGEIITLADRQAAITDLDDAVAAEAGTFARLSQAVAETQRVHAWDADEGFQAALASESPAVVIETDYRGKSQGYFVAWVKHRYPNWASPGMARRIGQAGQIVEAIQAAGATDRRALPQREWHVRPLTLLLRPGLDGKPKFLDSVAAVWQQARAEADARMARDPKMADPVARIAREIVKEKFPDLVASTPAERAAKTERKKKRFVGLFDELLRHLPADDFNALVEQMEQKIEARDQP